MNCQEWFDKLYRFLDKDLDQISWTDVESHMHQCRSCFSRYELEIKIRERLQASCNTECCTDSLRLKIKAILEKF